MLSGDVLQELLRPSAVQEIQVTTAWPSLSVESKLQIIQASQRGSWALTPSYLTKLALDDPHPIVRFWALRYAALSERPSEVPAPGSPMYQLFTPPSEEELELTRRARSDGDKLVRAMAETKGFDTTTSEDAQLRRFLGLRYSGSVRPHLSEFLDAIEAMIDSDSISDEDLAWCLYELFHSPRLEEISSDKMSAQLGEHAMNVNLVCRIWRLAKKAPPTTLNRILYDAPWRVGGINVMAEVFPELPLPVQKMLLSQHRWDVGELVNLVKSRPELFSADLYDELEQTE